MFACLGFIFQNSIKVGNFQALVRFLGVIYISTLAVSVTKRKKDLIQPGLVSIP